MVCRVAGRLTCHCTPGACRLAEVQIEREDLDLCTEDLEQAMALLKEERPHDHSRAFKVLSLLGLVMQARRWCWGPCRGRGGPSSISNRAVPGCLSLQMKGDLPGAIRHMSSGLETCQSRLATVRAELAAAGEGGAEVNRKGTWL